MRITSVSKEKGSLTAAVIIIFTVGVILGTVSLINMPKEIIIQVGDIFSSSLDKPAKLKDIIASQFVTELFWLSLIWILGTLSVMSPLIASISAVRGFTIGFSSAFIIAQMKEYRLKLLCTYILPQCIFSLPIMTFFSVLCIKSCMSRHSGESSDFSYFMQGILFLVFSLIASVFEGVISFWFGTI